MLLPCQFSLLASKAKQYNLGVQPLNHFHMALISLAVTYKHDCTGLHLHCIQNATSTNLNAKSDSKIKEQESCELRRSWAYIEGTIINRWMYLSERSNQRRSLVMLLHCCSFSSTITDYISKCSYFFCCWLCKLAISIDFWTDTAQMESSIAWKVELILELLVCVVTTLAKQL